MNGDSSKSDAAADVIEAEPDRPRKKRKLARASAQNPPCNGPLNDNAAAQIHLPMEHPETQKKARSKRKRKDTEAQQAQPGAAQTANPQQPKPAPHSAGDASETDGDAHGADASSPAGTEQKKQSRSARRKQLKRRFRRLGVAPPAQNPSSSSQHQSGLLNPAAAPAAAAATLSSSHPDTAPPANETGTPTGFPPPPKRLKTHPSKLRAQKPSQGHVYFAGSDSESDSAGEDRPEHKGKLTLHDEEEQSLQDQPSRCSQQKAGSKARQNGLHSSVPEQVPHPPLTAFTYML